MNSEMRDRLVLMHEGQALNQAAQYDRSDHATLVRCVVDGAMNALIRIEPPEEVAKYAFALSDRVVGRLRTPIEFSFAGSETTPEIAPSPETISPAPPAPRSSGWPSGLWKGYAIGAVVGFLFGMFVGVLAGIATQTRT